MKMTRWATCRANPISWVTTHMVMPSLASLTMTSSTSPIISGSRALVGSSKSMILGDMASPRAMATRCCWPPDSWPDGIGLVGQAHAGQFFPAQFLGFGAFHFSHIDGRQGDVLQGGHVGVEVKLLEDETDLRPQFGQVGGVVVQRGAVHEQLPFLEFSRRLMQRMRVDLPDPLGPQTTTTSPA
jgi:hypothetical protein